MKKYLLKYVLILLVAFAGMQQAGAKVWYATASNTNWAGKPAADVKGFSAAITAASAGDEIWVGAGDVVAGGTVAVSKAVLIYGGFKGTESKLEDREMVKGGQPWEFKNPTVLKAKDGVNIVLLNQTVNFAKKVIIDGLTITGGKQGINFGNNTHTETYIQNCIIKGNGKTSSYVDGGGIAIKHAAVTIQNCLIEGNVGKNGGGIYCEKGKVTNCTLADNYAYNGSEIAPTGATGGWGGGVFNNAGVVSNCIIKNNKARGVGGGFCVRVPASKFYNCLVVGNTAPYGGGVCYDGRGTSTKGAEIYNCILAENVSTKSGGAIYFTTDNQAAINCIFWGNKKNDELVSVEVTSGKKGCTLQNCVVQANSGTIPGTDNITLENRTDVFDAEDSYLPAKNFVGIDKGQEVAGMVVEDLAGNPRFFGKGMDIGAYEYSNLQPSGDVFYVDYAATGKNDGSSWEDAFTDIQFAINIAKVYNTKYDAHTQLWVAAGTYPITSIISIQSGVSIYGGFNKTEKSLGDRKYKANSTHPWDFANPSIIKGNKTCQLINSCEPNNDNAISTETYIDGFTLTGGKSTGSGDYYTCGGAAHLKQNMFVQNCIITDNEATSQGGGIALRGDANLCGVENCLIENNVANGAGGGVTLFGNSSKNYVRNCIIRNNESKATGTNTGGGGLYNFLGTAENCVIQNNKALRGGGVAFRRYLSTSVVNCLIEGNVATVDGGAVFLSNHNNQANVNIFNCTVVDNQAPVDKNTIAYMEDKYKLDNVKIVNCIFSGNQIGGVVNAALPQGMDITYSAFEKKMNGTENIVIPDDGSFWAENWHLAKTSPAKNAGTQSGITILDYDLDGADRVQDGVIDLGVYEIGANYAPDANSVFYVKVPASEDEENGIGSSWENHMNSVAVAVSAAKSYKKRNPKKHVQVWIAAGVHDIPTALEVVEDVCIYGGFAGTESALEERQKVSGGYPWEFVHETILDGREATQLFNQKEGFSTLTYLDGLTFRNAKHTDKGGAMYLQSNVMIQYCKFLNNTTTGNGGAVNFVGKDAVSKAVYSYFYGNKAGNGGAIFTESNKAEVENCRIEKNSAEKRGGGIYVYQGVVRNSYIYQNHCDGNEASLGGGGGLYGRDGGHFDNCIVVGNTSNRGAGIMAGLNPGNAFVTNVFNCIVADNKATESGAGLHASPCKSEYGLKAYNTVLWNNMLNSKPGHRMDLVQLFHCAVQDGTGINADVDQNCMAIATADKASAFDEDWKPVAGSPCIDAGTTEGITLTETDYAGDKRISNRKVDIGAYEYQNPADVFEINYKEETLVYSPDKQKVVECSADGGNWQTVAYSSLIGKEESKGFCRLQDEPTGVYALDIPGRGEASGSIDMKEEKLKSAAEGAEWNVTGAFTEIGDGVLSDYISAVEKEITIKQPATESAFKTEKVLALAARPEAPLGWELSYVDEQLKGIGDLSVLEATIKDEYVAMADSSVSDYLTTASAVNLKIRVQATETDFASFPWTIELAARPLAPVYTINYTDSTTVEDVSEYVVYDTVKGYEHPSNGENGKLKLQPGSTYYFKWAASDEGKVFNSETGILEVPAVTDLAGIRVNYAAEKLDGLNEYVCWKVDGGDEAKALEDISALINTEREVTLALYVPAGVNAFATSTQTITLPKREGAPEWAINYVDEVIYDAVELLTPDNWEIKLPGEPAYARLDESGLLTTFVPAPGEESKTFSMRTAAGVDAFHSEACDVTLTVRPAAPVYTIDYKEERTNEVVDADVEYSNLDDMEGAVLGGDTTAVLEPGVNLYFRVKALESRFASDMVKLTVPERPAIREVTIDFKKKELLDLPAAAVWQVNEEEVATAREDLSSIIPAVGEADATLKVWVPEQSNSFRSDVISLELPAYPADPELQIDYEKEVLEGITRGMMWSYEDTTYAAAADLSGLIPAYGAAERTLSVWLEASASSFRSQGETTVVLPARKDIADACSIDYVAETTKEVVPDEVAYRYGEDETWHAGDQGQVKLQTGVNVWFKRRADAANKQFASVATELVVPARPVITAEDMTIRLSDGEVLPDLWNSWTNTAEGIQMTVSDPEVAALNGYRIMPKKQGECTLALALPAVADEHFAAEPKTVALKVVSDGHEAGELKVSELKIAGRSDMVFRIPGLEGVNGVSLIVYNQRGKVIFEAREYGHDYNMGDLDAGTYYYVLTYPQEGKQQQKKGFVEIVR